MAAYCVRRFGACRERAAWEGRETPRRATPLLDPLEETARAPGAVRLCGNDGPAHMARCSGWSCVCTALERAPWT